MALTPTGDIIQACPLPATMVGQPQEWFDEYTRRLTIVSATGRGRIVRSDIEPTDADAVWLRGEQIWVFSTSLKRFVPLDISQSETHWFFVGSTTPTSTPPLLWLRTATGVTTNLPNTTSYGRAIGWYEFDGSVWRPFSSLPNSGTTAQRPSPGIDTELYFDTDIATMLIFERGAYRTLAGSPGDIKFVGSTNLEEALRLSPGWQLLGQSNASLRGRVLSGATRNQDGSDPLTVDANVPQRSVGETFGSTQGLTGNASLAITLTPAVAYYILTKE